MCLTAAECVKDLMAKGGWDISMIVTWQHDARKLAYLNFSLGKKCKNKKKDIDLFSSFIYILLRRGPIVKSGQSLIFRTDRKHSHRHF